MSDDPNEELWEIVQMVAVENYSGSQKLLCPFCKQQFIHTQDCIVTKARQLTEWRYKQPRVEVKL